MEEVSVGIDVRGAPGLDVVDVWAAEVLLALVPEGEDTEGALHRSGSGPTTTFHRATRAASRAVAPAEM